jgi:uncharacterized protein (TIGR02266 family)
MTITEKQIEARNDSRYKARIAIFNGQLQGKLISNYSVNISTGGVFMETDNVLPEDTLLYVKFKLPDNESVIDCKARVAWINEPVNPKKIDLPPGMGLHFLDLSLENIHAIRDYLTKGMLVPAW